MKFRSKISELSNRVLSINSTKNYLKKWLGYVYKKESSRSILSKMPKLKFMQAIFSCRIMNFIRNGDTIINVDEATFTQKIQQHYSWLPKSKNSSIINIKWRGSLSMVFALYNDGNWIWMILKSTMTSQKFWWFLMILRDYTEEVLRKTWTWLKSPLIMPEFI